MERKDSECIIIAIKEHTARFGEIKRIHYDAAKAFLFVTLDTNCHKNKIDYDGSAPEGQNTNAFAETHWKKMVIIARKLLIHAPLSKEFAIFALHYACKIHDVLPVKGLVDS